MSLDRDIYNVMGNFYVMNVDTGQALLPKQYGDFDVHPPAWAVNDFQLLHASLKHLAEIQFLREFRERIRIDPVLQILLEDRHYTVECVLLAWLAPQDAQGDRQVMTYRGNTLS